MTPGPSAMFGSLRTSGTTGTMGSMTDVAVAGFSTTHQFRSREARDHWSELLDLAEAGLPAVVRRGQPVVLMQRALLLTILRRAFPIEVQSSVSAEQVSMWLDGVPVHGVGVDFETAESEFLDALVDYAEDWVRDLRFAPNHKDNHLLVLCVLSCADRREELRELVFGPE